MHCTTNYVYLQFLGSDVLWMTMNNPLYGRLVHRRREEILYLSADVVVAQDERSQALVQFKSVGKSLHAFFKRADIVPLHAQNRDVVVHLLYKSQSK